MSGGKSTEEAKTTSIHFEEDKLKMALIAKINAKSETFHMTEKI